MKNRKEYEAAKKRLQKGLRKIIAESEQLSRDLAWWNENRLEHKPFDLGGDLATAALARKILILVNTDQRIPKHLWNRFYKQTHKNATKT